MQGVHLRKYGVETTVNFELYETDGVDFKVDGAHVAGDTKIMKDEGAEANTDNGFTDEGQGYSIVISATEMEAARIVIYVVDQGAKAWLDKCIVIETYGNASAMHAFDLDSATVTLSAATEGQIDAIEADTNEMQGKLPTNNIMGSSVKTDKDDEIDAIKAKTDNLPADPASETNVDANEAKLDIIDTNVDSILADTGTDGVELSANAVDDIWDEILTGATHNVNTSSGKRLREIADANILHTGTAQAGANSSITLAAGASALDGFYDHAYVVLVGNTGVGQARLIDTYVGATRVANLHAGHEWVTNPDNTTDYEIKASGRTHSHTVDELGTQAKLDVNAEADTALVDYDPPTRAEATSDKDEIITEVDANEAKIDIVDTVVDAIKAVTDNLPDSGALSDLATILADTNELQTDWTDGGRLDLLIDSIIQYLSNKCVVDVTGSKMDLYNDAGDSVIKTWALLDKDDSSIVVGTGVPTQRGVPS